MMFGRWFMLIGTLLIGGSTALKTPLTEATLQEERTFTTLTYNIAGLISFLSSAKSPRAEATQAIGCYINGFDVVHLQEDFSYHSYLLNDCNNHTHRSKHTGGTGIGSGLNTFSHERFEFEPLDQVRWGQCIDADCMTPKGFSVTQLKLEEGVYIHLYNIHAQAQDYPFAIRKRTEGYDQLVAFIERHSKDKAILIMGDFNTRYTTPEDFESLQKLLQGFNLTDVWVELIRGNELPQPDGNRLSCPDDAANLTKPTCEVVDKVLYRGNEFITLQPVEYRLNTDDKNEDGVLLSDHSPVFVKWRYQLTPDYAYSAPAGGTFGGYSFDDIAVLSRMGTTSISPFLTQLAVRATENKIISIEVLFSDGTQISHGDITSRKTPAVFSLQFEIVDLGANQTTDETLSILNERFIGGKVCTYNSGWLIDRLNRVGFLQLETSFGRQFTVGKEEGSADCHSYSVDSDMEIAGFHGRANAKKHIYQLGFLSRTINL